MNEMPVIRVAIRAAILAHRRNENAIRKFQISNLERIKQMSHKGYTSSLNRCCSECGGRVRSFVNDELGVLDEVRREQCRICDRHDLSSLQKRTIDFVISGQL